MRQHADEMTAPEPSALLQDTLPSDLGAFAPHSRLPYPPPLDALWSYRRCPPTDLNVIKAARAAMVWRADDGTRVGRAVARYLTGWLGRFPRDITRLLRANGARTRHELGRGYGGQIADLARVACYNGVMPSGYYVAGMARHRGGRELNRYVPNGLISTVIERITFERDPATFALSRDKYAFERRCRGLRLPVVQTIAVVGGKTDPKVHDPLSGSLPMRDLIIKPKRGLQGKGIERWHCVGPDCFERNSERLSASSLLARLSLQAADRGRDVLVQECAVNHPDLRPIAGAALATLRVVTALNESGKPEIVEAFYKTSTAPEACIDNFHGGGTAFPIDLATGLFGHGFVNEPWSPRTFTHHPETGAAMVDRIHPAWDEMRRFALQLHTTLPNFVLVGWDIGFTPEGPIAVEANVSPGCPLIRQARGEDVAGSRYLQLVAFHCREWLRRNERLASRWRAIDLS